MSAMSAGCSVPSASYFVRRLSGALCSPVDLLCLAGGLLRAGVVGVFVFGVLCGGNVVSKVQKVFS